MLKGFKDFLLRGNVIDLAVAVVIATAFTAVITAFTDGIINPLLAVLGPEGAPSLGFFLDDENPATFVNFGAIINAAINFVLVAAVIYFVVIVPVNRIKARYEKPAEADKNEKDVLLEIRDLLSAKS